ncbi:MAG: CPBP family intramembrane metalloprotease [Clostridia bacterium]|nr:CPBP family intramembrane metalloprotease [Clostridia bacterium]
MSGPAAGAGDRRSGAATDGSFAWKLAASWLFAALLWAVMFVWRPLNFWLLMSLTQGALIAISLAFAGNPFEHRRPTAGDAVLGAGSAALLYALFALGNLLSRRLLPGAGLQIGAIYAIRHGTPVGLVALLLLLLIGPGEEIFWRGWVQRQLEARLGENRAMLLTVVLYTGIHLSTGNPMLILAALAAGLVWSLMYRLFHRLWPNLISHALWDMAAMALFPFR